MNCKVCGKPGPVHLTEVYPSGEKVQSWYCLDHAEHAGLSPDQAQHARSRQAASDAFHTFVRTNRRVPTPDEMHQIGVLDADEMRSEEHVRSWTKVAAEILSEE